MRDNKISLSYTFNLCPPIFHSKTYEKKIVWRFYSSHIKSQSILGSDSKIMSSKALWMTFEHSLNALLNDRLILKFTGPELGFWI